LGKILVRSGFRVIAFDAPGHGKSLKPEELQQSSMFEYCRALWTVAQNLQPLHALIGHSLGAMSAIFTAAGHAGLSVYSVTTERLVSISAPANLNEVLILFCQQRSLDNGAETELARGLEQAFNFSLAEYSVTQALKQVKARILLVHDEDDDDVSVACAHQLYQARTDARLVLTQGAGHQRILANRTMIRAVKDFVCS
jgi:pimeloyl-ACP methyl ester carboxylesterase